MNREPTVIIGVIVGLIEAVIPMLLVFQIIHWTEVQTGAVMLVIAVAAKGLGIVLTRSQVVPVAKADAQLAMAASMPKGTSVAKIKEETEKHENHTS